MPVRFSGSDGGFCRNLGNPSTGAQWKSLGIKVPKTVEQAQRFDRESGNCLWMDANKKEMKHVMPAFSRAKRSLGEAKSGKALLGYH